MDYYVYIIRSGKKRNAPMKIGMTSDVESRVRQLQTGNPYPLRVEALFTCRSKKHAESLEKFMHSIYFDSRLCGEWFIGNEISLKKAQIMWSDSGMGEIEKVKCSISSGSSIKHLDELKKARRVNADLRVKIKKLGAEINRLNSKL